ncbi:SpoIIE family protein phosphatase, partial [Streptomyces sp. AS58]|uniref:SpoIIE family protein phosphatase n=1 Tax=Streptomyces sp. AS58 TaxID=1519489 RepID=UPI000A66BEB9
IIDPQGRVAFPALPTRSPPVIGRALPLEANGLELPEGPPLADRVQGVVEGSGDDPDQTNAAGGAPCLYAVYAPAPRRCTMAAAGHPPPAIIDPQGRVTFPDLPTGSP